MEPRKDIIEALKAGSTIKEAARATNTSPATVSLHKKAAGLSRKMKRRRTIAPASPTGEEAIVTLTTVSKAHNRDLLNAAITLLKQIG